MNNDILDLLNEGCGGSPIKLNHPVRLKNAWRIAKGIVHLKSWSPHPCLSETAKTLLVGLMLHTSTATTKAVKVRKMQPRAVRERTMGEVFRLLTLEEKDFRTLLQEMTTSPEDEVRRSAEIITEAQKVALLASDMKGLLISQFLSLGSFGFQRESFIYPSNLQGFLRQLIKL